MKSNFQNINLSWNGKNDYEDNKDYYLKEDISKSYYKQDTENKLIHGDNFHALKALEKDYTNKIKCIYIDPPYNTRKKFNTYNDSLEHSEWLNFMNQRLRILKNLLSEDGAIFIQIDDNEQAYLKVLCDEIFGRDNFISMLIPIMNPRGRQESKYPIAKQHEYIMIYSKNYTKVNFNLIKEDISENAEDKFRLLSLRKTGNESNRKDRPNMYYPIYFNPETNDISTIESTYPICIYPLKSDNSDGRWRWKKENVDIKKKELVVKLNSKSKYDIYVKDYLIKNGESKGRKLHSIIKDVNIINDKSKQHLKEILPNETEFSYPKSEFLINKIIELSTQPNDIVLDAFLGSGTTIAVAHKMKRRWIGIELGNQCYSHCLPRMKKVIDGEDKGGISKKVDWQGGGGYKFYEI